MELMDTPESTISQDLVFELLSSPRRRYVLYYLRQEDEPVELTELAEYVAAWENETDPEDITSQQRKRVYVSLYQTHIPKLDEAGIIDYDQDSGMITLTDQATAIDDYLVSNGRDAPWQQYYLGLAILGTAVLALAAFDVSVFAAVSETVVAAAIALAFVVSALAHFLLRRFGSQQVPEELQRLR